MPRRARATHTLPATTTARPACDTVDGINSHPRGTTDAPGRGRAIISTKSRPIVDQITRIVAANETLQRENAALRTENDRLRAELRSIGDALDGLTTVSDRSRSQMPDSDR